MDRLLPLGVVIVATGPLPPVGLVTELSPVVCEWLQPAKANEEKTAREVSRAALRRVSCMIVEELL